MLNSLRSSRGFASLSVLSLIASVSVVGVVGSGMSTSLLEALPGGAWLASSVKGDVVLADSASGNGVARAAIPGAKGTKMSVVHRGGFACVRSEAKSGEITVNCVDDATFLGAGSSKVKASQKIVRTGDAAYMIDESKGLVRVLDTSTLKPIGEPLTFEAPISTTPDDEGRLLVVEPETSMSFIVADMNASEPMEVGTKKGDLFPLLANGEFAVVAQADAQVTVFAKGAVDRRVGLPGNLTSILVPTEVEGPEIAMLSRGEPGVEVVALELGTDKGRRVKVRGSVPKAASVYSTSAGLFVPDAGSGKVTRIDTKSGATEVIDLGLGKGEGSVEIFVKDDQLWANNPNGSKALVIDSQGRKREVNKYDPDIETVDPGWNERPVPEGTDTTTSPARRDPAPTQQPGSVVPITVPVSNGPGVRTPGPDVAPPESDAPATATTKAPSASAPPESKPPSAAAEAPPGEPTTFDGQIGNGALSLSWGPPSGGGPVQRYELSCDPSCGKGQAMTLDGGKRSHQLNGLRNGTRYSFSLVAANDAGRSAPATVSNLMPAIDLPNPPTNVRAKSLDDGSGAVLLSWSAPSGDGFAIDYYSITCDSTASVTPKSTGAFRIDSSATSLRLGPAPWTESGGLSDGIFAFGYDNDSKGDWSCSVQTLGHYGNGGATLAPSEPIRSNVFDPWHLPSWLQFDVSRSSSAPRSVAVSLDADQSEGRQLEYSASLVGGSEGWKRVSVGGGAVEFVVPWETDFMVEMRGCVGTKCVTTTQAVEKFLRPTISLMDSVVTSGCYGDGSGLIGKDWDTRASVDLKGMNAEFVKSTHQRLVQPHNAPNIVGGWRTKPGQSWNDISVYWGWVVDVDLRRKFTVSEVWFDIDGDSNDRVKADRDAVGYEPVECAGDRTK